MREPKVLILIPARFASTRFPGKPLATINGKSMIQMVYERSALSQFKTVVVTDDERIETEVKKFGGNVVVVKDDVPSGTERIALAYERFFKSEPFDLVINVQGDEPLIDGLELRNLSLAQIERDWDIGTFVKSSSDREEFHNPNRVKVIYSKESGRCHYFSRSAIPFDRDNADANWFLHIGVYSYRPSALLKFARAPMGYYENREKLEQLRALEMGQVIGAMKTEKNYMGIDTPEDLIKLQGVLGGTNN